MGFNNLLLQNRLPHNSQILRGLLFVSHIVLSLSELTVAHVTFKYFWQLSCMLGSTFSVCVGVQMTHHIIFAQKTFTTFLTWELFSRPTMNPCASSSNVGSQHFKVICLPAIPTRKFNIYIYLSITID